MRTHNPSSIHPPFGAYSCGVEITARRLLLTSGQLGIKPDGTIPETLEDQTNVCFASIDAILAEANLDRGHILKLNAFVTKRDHFPGYMKVRDRYLADVDDKPASTLVIVSGFSRPEFLVEIEATAAKEEE